MEKNIIGQIIGKARRRAGLSLSDLSKKAKVKFKILHGLECGYIKKVKPRVFKKISKVLNISYENLMYKAGYGYIITPLNPFLKYYYCELKPEELDSAKKNNIVAIKERQQLIKYLNEFKKTKKLSNYQQNYIDKKIDDIKYEINDSSEIIKLIDSLIIKNQLNIN